MKKLTLNRDHRRKLCCMAKDFINSEVMPPLASNSAYANGIVALVNFVGATFPQDEMEQLRAKYKLASGMIKSVDGLRMFDFYGVFPKPMLIPSVVDNWRDDFYQADKAHKKVYDAAAKVRKEHKNEFRKHEVAYEELINSSRTIAAVVEKWAALPLWFQQQPKEYQARYSGLLDTEAGIVLKQSMEWLNKHREKLGVDS